MRQARAGLANFRKASLYRVQFEDSDMVGADLTDVLLESADLSEVKLNRRSIGSHILQEMPAYYSEHLRWDDPELTETEWNRFFVHRLERAREV